MVEEREEVMPDLTTPDGIEFKNVFGLAVPEERRNETVVIRAAKAPEESSFGSCLNGHMGPLGETCTKGDNCGQTYK